MFGEDLYPTIHLKAAALVESLVFNHALVDGNRPLAFAATVVFYGLNGHRVQLPHQDAAVDLLIAIATGAADLHGVATTLGSWTRVESAGP
jgi:death-on-curing protein